MKNKFLNNRKIIFILINSVSGFAAFLFVVLLGELISGSFNFNNEFHFETIHLQIALLGGIIQGSLYFFKSPNESA